MNAFDDYENLRRALRAGTRPSDHPGAERFLAPDALSGSASQAHAMLIGSVFPPEPLLDYLRAGMDADLAACREKPEYRGRNLAWTSSYLAQCALMAHARCPGAGFFDIFLDYADYVVTNRDTDLGITDTYHGRIMPAWSSRKLDPKKNTTMVTHAGRIMGPVMRAVRLSRDNPDFALNEERTRQYTDAFMEAFAAFGEDWRPVPDTPFHWFKRPVNEVWEPLNHVLIVADAALDAWAVTGAAHLRDWFDDVIAVLEDSATRHPDGSVGWPYSPRFASASPNRLMRRRVHALRGRVPRIATRWIDRLAPPDGPAGDRVAEPIWKAAMSIPALATAVELGIHDRGLYVDPVADTFIRDIATRRGLRTDMHPGASAWFDPATWPRKSIRNAEHLTGWLTLAGLRPDLVPHVTEFVAANPDLFVEGWFGHPLMARGYAANVAVRT